jgi:hypothetical protein
MLSIKRPGSVVQVDDHEGDINVVTKDGTAVPHKVHALVMFCVATSAILAAVLCLGDPTEEDYMRLVKQAMESKTAITLEAGCSYTWDCSCKPVLILHDRGKIFDSARESGPGGPLSHLLRSRARLYPQVKGHIEALFTWISKSFPSIRGDDQEQSYETWGKARPRAGSREGGDHTGSTRTLLHPRDRRRIHA